MPEFYTWTIYLKNQLGEIGEKQLSVFGSRGGQICPLIHIPLCSFFANWLQKMGEKSQQNTIKQMILWECSGSVVECLTRDWGFERHRFVVLEQDTFILA